MTGKPIPSLVLVATIATLLLSSCAPAEVSLVVWSNIPEVAFVVERYNYLEEAEVRFRYVENLTQALTQQRPEADVVIGRWVNTPVVNTLMVPRAGYFPADATINADVLDSSPEWVPLSFNLPALVFSQDSPLNTSGYILSLNDLSQLYTGEAPAVRFAPTSDAGTLYALHRSLGFAPAADAAGNAQWDDGSLERAARLIRDWQVEYNGGPAEETAYIERYLYVPPLRQLEMQRVAVVQMPSNRLFTWRFFDERRFAFRWLASPDGILTAGEDIVYGGIPATSEQRGKAITFIRWATDPEVQTGLVRAKIEERVDSFGVFDGFSTISETNRAIEATIYPELAGRIPDPGALRFPAPLPQYWDEARSAIVEPSLKEGVSSSTDLAGALDLWYRQRGD